MNPLSTHVSRVVLATLATAIAFLISGCGGGGGGGSSAPPPGALDASFGGGGEVFTSIGGDAQANAVVLQPDGKIIAAGGAVVASQGVFALTRYNADGTLDSGFGTGGTVVSTSFITSNGAEATGVTLQPDGRIVVAGSSSQGDVQRCTIVRLNTDGSPDLTFGTGGVVMMRITSLMFETAACSAPTVLASGQILVAVAVDARTSAEDSELYIGAMRFDPGGARDDSFGVGGVAKARTGVNPTASSLVVQRDGSILVGGGSVFLSVFPPMAAGESVLARFDRAGMPDPGFGQGGVIYWGQDGFNGGVGGIALQPDDKIVVAVCCEHLLRLLPNSAPDTSFGVGGTVTLIGGSVDGPGRGPGVAIQSNGKIVVGGLTGNPFITAPSGFALWRFGPDGLPDAGFGNGGSVVTMPLDGAVGHAVAIQRDGRIVLAGSVRPDPNVFGHNFAVARYFGDPVTTSPP